MEEELTEVFCGSGRGKTTLAMGQGLKAAAQGKSVIVIQFLKGREGREFDFLEQLEDWDIKVFRFEKLDTCYQELTEQEQEEEKRNILNGLNFARKVVATRECDFLVLDELLGLLDCGITKEETIEEILKLKDESMHIVMTGRSLPEGLRAYADSVTTLTTEEFINR